MTKWKCRTGYFVQNLGKLGSFDCSEHFWKTENDLEEGNILD